MSRVAFLGLGAIGAPMARHLARKYDLAVWNRTASRAVAFASTHHGTTHARTHHGTTHERTTADADAMRDVVITCLPTSREVESLLDGANGLIAGLQKGAILVDCTSGDPATSRRIAARLADAGVGFIDAPVSGGVSGAEKGELTVMCGGSAKHLETVRPVLESFGKKIVHCGDVGAGDAIKAVNNALLAVHIWATAEGLAALAKSGVDPKIALDVINASSGRSNTSMNLFPERVMSRAFPRTFRLALLDKDVGIAANVAREQKIASPLLQLTAELFRLAHGELGEEADHVEAVRLVEKWAGAEIR
ncbi:MAG: NAD(P)-dependent oxidoreductase [Gemmatimonadaceae bacterium]|nr:NAD(P)-dependent oxidoreductase [Gemmatimonadaceae bacterium]